MNRSFEFSVLVPFFQCGVSEQKRPKPKARRTTPHRVWLCRATARKKRIGFQNFIENCEIAYYFLSYQVFFGFSALFPFFRLGGAAFLKAHAWEHKPAPTSKTNEQQQTKGDARIDKKLEFVGDDGLQFTPAVP